MAYEIKPNSGSLFVNEKKTSDAHPDFQGKIIISAELIRKLANQGGDLQFDVSGWKKTTGSGKNLLSLAIKEPYKRPEPTGDYSSSDRDDHDYKPKYKAGTPPKHYAPEVIREPQTHQQPPAPTKPQYTPEDIARGKLKRFKAMLEACKNLQEVIDLDHQLHEPDRWKHFEVVAIVANEAQDLLEEYKEKFIPKEPTDHSDLIAKIDTQFQRLGLPPKAHCLARWNKSRAMLTAQELQIYLDELAIAKPILPSDDFF